ncbi:MAG TPA: dTMP kinase [Patescibacteria group bacterium]|nr:dTMP kinase [Patescibacteria group bacterium]
MGRLIVFEGIDGSGKTSLSRMFHAYLLEKGVSVIWLREPTDSPLGEKIRLLAQNKESISIHEELEYFLEDRRWDVENNILPALRSGKTVILDRYYYSNACYQGARGLDMEAILSMNRQFAPEADLVFIIDVDVDRALARISTSRQGVAKLFEKNDFLEKVRANYLKLTGANLERIDGNPDLKTVMADVINRHKRTWLKKVTPATKK